MIREEFRTLIESIGFKKEDNYIYYYKEFKLYLYNTYYTFYNGSVFYYCIPLNDLTEVLKLSRSIKLKTLLK